MRWHDCKATVLFGDNIVFITLMHQPTNIALTRRYTPSVQPWMMDDIFEQLDNELDIYTRSKS